MPVRDYSAWSHEEDIRMPPEEVHERYNSVPPEYPADLENALAAIAKQDVSLTGGPRGKLEQHRRD